MAVRRRLLVPAAACLSVVASVVVLVVADRGREQIPSETVNVAVIGAGAAAMTVLLWHRKPDNNLWRVLLVIAVNGPLALLLYTAWLRDAHPNGALVGSLWMLDVLLAVPWMLFAGLFPDGHRPLRAWPWLVTLGAMTLLAVSIGAWVSARSGAAVPVPGHLAGAASGPADGSVHALLERAASVLTGLLPLAALGGLAWRYRLSGPAVRQQIRVGILGLAIGIVLEIALRILPGAQAGRMQLAVTVVAVGLGQLAVAAALLRWRLWLVDRALPRAVVLGACSAAFTGLIVAGALLLTGQVGRPQVRVAVVSAVVVTVVVQGYSRRLEPWVRRLVYGERPDGVAVLIGLADGLAALDDQTAASRIAEATRRGLSVPWAALWTSTARPGIYRLSASNGLLDASRLGTLAPGPGRGSAACPAWLLEGQTPPVPWPDGTAAVARLGAGPEPWGVLAVGERRGDPLSVADVELLAGIARESELARTNRHLRHEVAASVEALQARAVQLQESRQRLVAAQDEERRRIERDLHDGAQHELISLASELRQLSRDGTAGRQELEGLASQAESAVFSLQDLARGIYPSVLTDRGLVAAIRSLAGRLPLDVVLTAGADLDGRRWPSQVETALYFVAVESLGNVRKHARPTTSSVTLALCDARLTLEIYDDGCGFDPDRTREGSGLHHMEDRVAALGGTLSIQSRHGAGTWIVASVPPEAANGGLPGQWPVADSLR